MRGSLLRRTNRIILIFLIITVPAGGFCESDKDFPFHIGGSVEKELVYPYAFEDVWKTAMAVLKDMDTIIKEEMREKGMESFKTAIKDDKNTGLITYTTSHKGKSGFFSKTFSPEFTYWNLFVYPLGDRKTCIYVHEISFLPYGGNIFDSEQFARRLNFTSSRGRLFKEIHGRLEGRADDIR